MANEMQNNPMQKVAYHVIDGAAMMYTVDANAACATFPEEWSFKPWSSADTTSARARREDQRRKAFEEFKAAAETNKALGLPPPPVPAAPAPLPPEPTDAEKAEMEADAKARAEAAVLLAEQDKKDAEKKAEDDKVAAARALLDSVPPQPDPNARRPFGRKGELTEAEKAAAAKRAAAKPAADSKA